ncbi:MAG: hypothetical protein II727_00310 [Oscillospiraceae bacterium]|nr:hypothetical protein [Oscillospiraceae bacterium]
MDEEKTTVLEKPDKADAQETTVLEEYGKYVDIDSIKPSGELRIGSDLSRFDNREEVRRAVRAAQQEEARTTGAPEEELPPRSRVSFGTLLIFVLFAVVASILINCYVRQNELSVELAHLKTEYTNEQVRNQDLQTRFDQRYVLSDIEDYAVNKLGMVKFETNQIEYIEIETPETITRVDNGEDGEGFNLFSFLKEKIEQALEFLT